MAYDLGPVTLKSITGYVHYRGVRTTDSDFSSSTVAIDLARTQTDTFTEEVQLLSSTKGPLEYVLGWAEFRGLRIALESYAQDRGLIPAGDTAGATSATAGSDSAAAAAPEGSL